MCESHSALVRLDPDKDGLVVMEDESGLTVTLLTRLLSPGLSHAGYLYNRTLWSGVCLEPRGVVLWNVALFSVMGAASGLQTLLCGANILNSLLGLILGQGFCHNKVCVLISCYLH